MILIVKPIPSHKAMESVVRTNHKSSFSKVKEKETMKSLFFKIVVLCLTLVFLVSVDGIAQERRIGTNAASLLLIPVGARDIALGGANLATVSGAEAIFWNPAGAANSNYTADVMFSYMSHIADINVNYVALAVKFGGFGTIGFSLKAMDIGDIIVTSEVAPDGTGALLSPQFLTAGLTYSRQLTEAISFGGTVNLISETFDRVSSNGVAFDFGVQYRGLAAVDGLSLGVTIKNLGPAMQYGGSGLLNTSSIDGVDRGSSPLLIQAQKDELPSYFVIGLSYKMSMGETGSLELASTFQDNNFQDDTGQFGAEYNYDDMFYVRGGYTVAPDAADEADIYSFTLGGGIHYDFSNIGVTIDYAYRDVDFFDASSVFSIKLGF